jgi:membrane-associated protease RseP (regulator of RpoE activity)
VALGSLLLNFLATGPIQAQALEPSPAQPVVGPLVFPPDAPHRPAYRDNQRQGLLTLRRHEDVFGLSVSPADATLREQLGLENRGLAVTAVQPNSPSAAADIRENDILLTAKDKPLLTVDDFRSVLSASVETPVAISLLRAGAKKTITLTPNVAGVRGYQYGYRAGQRLPRPEAFWIGVSISPASEILRSQLKLEKGVGLVIESVVPESPAAKAGLKTNDVMLSVGPTAMRSLEDLLRAVREAKDLKPISLKYRRAGQESQVDLTPERRKDIQLTAQPPGGAIGVEPTELFRFGFGGPNNLPYGPATMVPPGAVYLDPTKTGETLNEMKAQIQALKSQVEDLKRAMDERDRKSETPKSR